MVTDRDRLEKEVRITARKPRSVEFLDKQVNISGIPFSAIEDVGDKLAGIFTPFLKMAVRPVGDGEAVADAGRDVLADFDLAGMAQMAPGIRDVAKILIETGTDLSWDDARNYEWLSVVHLAMEVLKYNLGAELRDFFTKEVREIGEVFGIKAIESVTTQPNAPSSKPDTASEKSPE